MELNDALDIISLGIIVFSGLLSLMRGFTKEILSILSWGAAAIIAFYLAPDLDPMIRSVPFLAEFFAGSCILSLLVSYTICLILILILISLFTPIMSEAINKSILSQIDKLLGLAFGVLRGGIIIITFLIFSEQVLPDKYRSDLIEGSQTNQILNSTARAINEKVPEYSKKWLSQKYQVFTQSCNVPFLDGEGVNG